MAKKKATATASAPGSPEVYNPAAGYSAPPQSSYGSGYGQQPSNSNATATPTAPPPRNTNPFINAKFLWELGKPVRARITGVRAAVGGNSQFGNKKGWFLDVQLENGTAACGRVNEGDSRHVRLWDKYQAAWVGREIVLRLSNPGDNTKAPWTLDAL